MGAMLVRRPRARPATTPATARRPRPSSPRRCSARACATSRPASTPTDLIRGMKQGVEAATAVDRRAGDPGQGQGGHRERRDDLANNDPEVGKIMADAFEKVGKDGVITVEEGKSLETEVTVVEGMQFDRGYLSGATSSPTPDEMKVELDKCLVLIHEDKIEGVKTLVPLLEKVMKAKKPLLIIAEDIDGRGALHARHQQAPRHAAGRGRQGPGLRRPPQGDAAGHRGPHRREADHEGPRPRPRHRRARGPGHGQEGRGRQRQHDHHRGRGLDQGDPARIEQIRRRSRTPPATTTARSCRSGSRSSRRRGAGPRRRGLGDRAEREEGPRRGRAARDPRGARGGHRPRRRPRSRRSTSSRSKATSSWASTS
jgi:hypothetical protein